MKAANTARKLNLVVSNSKSKVSKRGNLKSTQLKLVKGFDAEEAHEAAVAKQQSETADNEVVLDFSSNFAALKTCLGMVQNLNRLISGLEADNTVPEHEKAEKLKALYVALERFEESGLRYLEAHLVELNTAA